MTAIEFQNRTETKKIRYTLKITKKPKTALNLRRFVLIPAREVPPAREVLPLHGNAPAREMLPLHGKCPRTGSAAPAWECPRTGNAAPAWEMPPHGKCSAWEML